MTTWTRVPREKDSDGDCFFDGERRLLRSVETDLPPGEVDAITADLQDAVEEFNGLGYEQVYRYNGRAVHCIDVLSRSLKRMRSPEKFKEVDFWVMVFSHEL